MNNLNKYNSIDNEKIEEDDTFNFLKKPNYNNRMRIHMTNSILIYHLEIDLDVIKKHIENILMRRDAFFEDTIIYSSSSNRTYVYMSFSSKYEPKRYMFDIKINGVNIIPHIRVFNKTKIQVILDSLLSTNKSIIYNKDAIRTIKNQHTHLKIGDTSYFIISNDKISEGNKTEAEISKTTKNSENENQTDKNSQIDKIGENIKTESQIDKINESTKNSKNKSQIGTISEKTKTENQSDKTIEIEDNFNKSSKTAKIREIEKKALKLVRLKLKLKKLERQVKNLPDIGQSQTI